MAKEVKTRIQHKHDTIENWGKAVNFKPLPGELIIYDDYVPPRVKIGNGEDYVADLMFLDEMLASLDSPVFTGTPAAPTAARGTNTTQLATTAHVKAAATKIAYGSSQPASGTLVAGDWWYKTI